MKHTEETKRKISETLKRKGIKPTVLPSREQCIKNLEKTRGQVLWNKGRTDLPPSWNAGLKGYKAGELNCNWKGGITSENHKIRTSFEYKLWRKACFERDNFTCQVSGKSGGELVVHHINNFAEFPELRTTISNGITLSKDIHKKFHKEYGNKNNTKEQLEDFIKIHKEEYENNYK